MLIFDQLKKNDPQLRLVTVVVLTGLIILLAGLWWVQVVSVREHRANLETQSYRTVRIPAVRGKILDRNGVVLAENRPTYNVSLYLEELRKPFDAAYSAEVARARGKLKADMEARESALGRSLNRKEKRAFALSSDLKGALRQRARYDVASNVVMRVGQQLHQPLELNPTNFQRHYETRLALPLPIVLNLDATNIARFEEQSFDAQGVDLEIQSTRFYPGQTLASHVLGRLRRDDSSAEGEEAFFSYRLPDFRGVVGLEYGFDRQLRGMAGAKSVLVNNVGYRQTENIWSPAEPGRNLVLTLDAEIQSAAERALPIYGPTTRGAVVVMEVQTGDILAMASSPTLNPNYFIQGFPRGEWQRISNVQAEKNRATQMNYAPGSVFKIVVGLAALESGLNPQAVFRVEPDPTRPGYGCIFVGKRKIDDTAPPGEYNFRRALKLSSNSYFIDQGLHTAGIQRIVQFGQQFHLGERVGLPTQQEVAGIFPSPERVRARWVDGDTANICIGQGAMAVTPLQMATVTAAIANDGKVLWPRLVDRVEPVEPGGAEEAIAFPRGQVREVLQVRPRSLAIIRDAMLADVEDADGTGVQAAVPGLRICGKTGTAQVTNERNQVVDHITWFISFAPFEKPQYAVVVMVESGRSGGSTCAPIAKEIYTAIQRRDVPGRARPGTLAQAQ